MARTATTWKPGQSGNPGGRPRVAREIRAGAQADSPEAYAEIRRIMREGDKDAARLAAAVKVLQLAGVPMSEDKAPEAPEAHKAPARDLSPEELERIAAQGEG
jgi:hypothetical protein